MIKLRRNIENSTRIDDELSHESWQGFWKLLLQFPTHDPDYLLLQYFYISFNIVNKSTTNRLFLEGLMKQTFTVFTKFLVEVTKLSKAWYTYRDYTSFSKGGIPKVQLARENQRDKVIERIVK